MTTMETHAMRIGAKLCSNDEALLIFGSLNAKPEDRYRSRSDISPAQLFFEGSVVKVPFFDSWGELGVSSMARIAGDDSRFYMTTGSDLIELRVNDRLSINKLEIPNLKDVHEITLIDDLLWLANTKYDEAVALDIKSHKIVHRIRLEQFRLRTNVTQRDITSSGEDWEEIDRFHCNQVFKGLDGKLYALVHHTTGKQLVTRIAKKLIKKQGDGGVIDLSDGRGIQLWLWAPHSVRIVNGEYWVFDSGNLTINVYGPDWRLRRNVYTNGWGRGADLSSDNALFYAGISEKRARYRTPDDSISGGGNRVDVFRVKDGVGVGRIRIDDGIEQVNNVYVIPRSLAVKLMNL